jgi:hypothetical protein
VPKVPRFNGGVDAPNSNAMQSKSLSLSARVLRACLSVLVKRGLRAHSSVDYEFSRSSMEVRWRQGISDMRAALRASPWLAPMPKELGVRVFDIM